MPGESVVEMVWGERCGVILRVGVQFFLYLLVS